LSKKYPKIISSVEEGSTEHYEESNPNGECDALYLDMNGIG
jgi:5'-3' exonuclease